MAKRPRKSKGFKYVVEHNGIPKLRSEFRRRVRDHVAATALAIEDEAKRNAPIDLGALRGSIHVVTSTKNGYPDAVAEAEAAAGEGGRAVEFAPPGPRPGPLEAEVAVGVVYGPHVEFGTERQGAQPYLGPAVTAHQQDFFDGMSQILQEAAEAAADE